VQIVGNPTASQFPGVNAGVVKLSAYNAAGTAVVYNNTYLITATSKNYYSFSNLVFETAHTSTVGGVQFLTSRYIKFTKCVFRTENAPTLGDGGQVRLTPSASTAIDATFDQCYFGATSAYGIALVGASQSSDTTVIKDCYFDSCQYALLPHAVTATILNCTFVGGINGIYQFTGSANAYVTVKNCLFKRCTTAIVGTSSVSGVQTYNRFIGCGTTVTNIPSSVTSTSDGVFGVDTFESLLFGLNNLQPFTSYDNSPNKSFGNATGAPVTDLYGVTWTGTSPDAGAATYRPVGGLGAYYPTERNASTITIAPGSTSQSIELYLGATGLTFATSGLSAYYVRNRSAPVAITLVTQTATGSWASGGFAEISSSLTPGVYRLDLPDAALAAGSDDVTIVVRGASGTNGAVMTVKLSSGGLTSAQTAAAVWDPAYTSYTAANSMGARVLKTTVDNRPVVVGTSQHIHANVHAIVDSTIAADELSGALLHNGTDYIDSDVVRISTSAAAADELEGALLHNGTDYIDSNLLSGNSTRVFVGRFQMTQTGTTQGDIIEAFTTDTPAFELQLFDGDNNLVPVTGATLGLRILDVTSTVVETGTPTIEYGTGGIVRWTAPGTYLSIGCPAGMYRMFVDRTVSGTTTTFGPLQIKVQVQ
jgi:hypothetical protein